MLFERNLTIFGLLLPQDTFFAQPVPHRQDRPKTFFRDSNMAAYQALPLHEGEITIRSTLGLTSRENPSQPGLPGPWAARISASPLIALGTLDDEGRPWATVWGGEAPSAQLVGEDMLGMRAKVDANNDPVFKALWKSGNGVTGQEQQGVVRPQDGKVQLISGLAIDLETRNRIKFAGRWVGGAVAKTDEEDEVQMAVHVLESLGNCPKYLNKRHITPQKIGSGVVQDSLPMSRAALELLAKADAMFISTTNGQSMDTNYRGGSPGFIRVAHNDEGGVVLVYPEC